MALLSFKWLAPFFFTLLHPFYVSVTEVEHNAKEATLEISCKLFAEDVEEVLKNQYKTSVDLGSEKTHLVNEKIVERYLRQHLTINADGKPLQLNFVGFEKQAESVYCYFEVPKVPSVKKIDLKNSLLQDFSEKQMNIMHVTVGGQRKSIKLDFPDKTASFVF